MKLWKRGLVELREEARTLEVLNRTGTAVGAELELERLVQTVTDAGVELSGAQFGAVFYNVLQPNGEAYALYTLSGAPREFFEKFPMPRNTASLNLPSGGPGLSIRPTSLPIEDEMMIQMLAVEYLQEADLKRRHGGIRRGGAEQAAAHSGRGVRDHHRHGLAR
jgi:GAF domain-containing protein